MMMVPSSINAIYSLSHIAVQAPSLLQLQGRTDSTTAISKDALDVVGNEELLAEEMLQPPDWLDAKPTSHGAKVEVEWQPI